MAGERLRSLVLEVVKLLLRLTQGLVAAPSVRLLLLVVLSVRTVKRLLLLLVVV